MKWQLVMTNVGQFSFFCENQLILVLTLCYENLIGSHIYMSWWKSTKFWNFLFFSNSLGSQIGGSCIYDNSWFSYSILTTWFFFLETNI
jgi:hypothetical protein